MGFKLMAEQASSVDFLRGTNRPRDNTAHATNHGPSEASEGHE